VFYLFPWLPEAPPVASEPPAASEAGRP
jgi:hypothetical protein